MLRLGRLRREHVRGLPSPVKLPEFFTFSNEQRPNLLKQTDLFPSLNGSVNGRIITINRGDMVPLASGAEIVKSKTRSGMLRTEDQPFNDPASILPLALIQARKLREEVS